MVFTKRLREGIRRGRIKCSVRIWTRPHVKAGVLVARVRRLLLATLPKAGKGKTHRHIAFTEESEVGRPAVNALLRAALAAWKSRAADRAPTEAQVVRRTRGA
jgi:hypothetical protein